MKLTSLQIDEFRQFKNFRIDFTDPATGAPLEKVCFIGPNGTGKSTLLKAIVGHAYGDVSVPNNILEITKASKVTWPGLQGHLNEEGSKTYYTEEALRHLLGRDLMIVNCPVEGDWDYRKDFGSPLWYELPNIDLNTSLLNAKVETNKHRVDIASAEHFWGWLITQVHERRRRLGDFQRLPQNSQLTIAQIDALFDPKNPKILPELAAVWNRILNLADLEFDVDSASIPFHLTDNLKVFVRTRTGHKQIPYGALSSGIIHYLFRLGHIWSLYFNRPPGDSLLLVDEPEGSLYPDFLYEIVENYREVAPGCQLFMATHSPIVAAQFKPEERFILTFGDDGYVTARRGTSPEGDDPNDLLRQDFGVASLMTEVGERAWDRFLQLRRLIPKTPEAHRLPLIEEYTRLGQAYHFAPPGGTNGDGV